MSKPKRCGNCGSSKMVLPPSQGLTVRWKDYPAVRLIEKMDAWVCQDCGELSLKASQMAALDALTEKSITAHIRHFIQTIVERENCDQREIAAHLGVSPEYLSEIKSGRKIPSFQTFNFLKILALADDTFSISAPNFNDWKIA